MTTFGQPLGHWFARVLLAISLALAPLSVSLPARAEPSSSDELDAARARFFEGLSLEAGGSWAQALSKFERVAQVRFTPQVRFHIARCKEHLGRFTEALGDYRISEYEAQRDALPELAEIADARATLEARVPRLTIVRGEGTERATVELDGVEIGEAGLGAEFGVDLGAHRVVAKSPGHEPFELSFRAEEGGHYEVTLQPGRELVRASDEPSVAPQAVAETTSAPPGADARSSSPRTGRLLPWVLTGVAIAGAGAGGVFLVRRSDAIDEQRRYCVGAVCNADFRARVLQAESDEESSGKLAIAAFSLSALALGTAVTLWLTSEESSRAGPAALRLTTDGDGARLSLGGRF